MTPLPTFVQIEPVGQCNLSCLMCPVNLRTDRHRDGTPSFMPFDRFVSLLDQLPGLKELHLQGLGEPMMHPRFFDMVTHAVGRGILVSCNSNFTLVNEGRAERCVSSGLQILNLSLDGATAETYEAIRGGASFHRVLGNIRLLQRIRTRLASVTPTLTVTVVIMRRNLGELTDIVRLAHNLGIRSVFVQHLGQDFTESAPDSVYRSLQTFVNQESLLLEDRAAIDASFSKARRAAAELGIALRLPRIDPATEPSKGRRCDWPWKGGYFTYQGYAVPCCMIATPDRAHFGNAFEQNLTEVWNSKEADSFRRRLESDNPPELCASCSVYKGVF